MGVILEYLNKRKEKWLKSNISANMSEEAVEVVLKKAEEKFSLGNWIPDAAKRAKQLPLATHVCKYSHPDAKASPIFFKSEYRNDGYLHSGNVTCEIDAFGNAAASDVFEFLLTAMSDERTILEHLESDSTEIKNELQLLADQYCNLKAEFLEIIKSDPQKRSDERVKQVYFPIGDNYHLLSILTSSGILSVLKSRIREMREGARLSKDKSSNQYGEAFDELYELTEIAFGGAKPINIGILNNRRNGKSYMLSSRPPILSHRTVTRPRYDFFGNTLRVRGFREDFKNLHLLFKEDRNNRMIRSKIRRTIRVIIDKVMSSVYALRAVDQGWSNEKSYSQLSVAQKIWLDSIHDALREESSEWIDEIASSFAHWIIHTYENILKQEKIVLGDGEAIFIKDQVEQELMRDKGFFR